jgi:hypothetical protein
MCVASPTPAGEVAKTVHVGLYDRLSDAHDAIHTRCLANNWKIAQASRETYGDWTEDPALLETTIRYLDLTVRGNPSAVSRLGATSRSGIDRICPSRSFA